MSAGFVVLHQMISFAGESHPPLIRFFFPALRCILDCALPVLIPARKSVNNCSKVLILLALHPFPHVVRFSFWMGINR
jgi:hypothetical protein